jgi:curved DNA-binding protein CbpA
MATFRPGEDPYRVLGVLRGADLDQIKAAHRRLAKRFHPDRATGDEQRFLAVQEAYQLLSDPRRRAEWDHRHAPVPTWSPAPRGPSERRSAAPSQTARASAAGRSRGKARPGRPARPPGQRTATWSAAHVPWWEEFRPRTPDAAASTDGPEGAPAGPPRRRRAANEGVVDPGADVAEPFDLDAHSRSSGAAWSAAARRHFRRGDRDLPSRGAWRYRGTQVVTGAEARKVAAEEVTRGDEARRGGDAEDEPVP